MDSLIFIYKVLKYCIPINKMKVIKRLCFVGSIFKNKHIKFFWNLIFN